MDGKKTYFFVVVYLLNAITGGVLDTYPDAAQQAVNVITMAGMFASLRHAINRLPGGGNV